MGAATGTREAAATAASRRAPARRGGEAVIDCLVARHRHLPRDRMGQRLPVAGRQLLIQAAHDLYGLSLTAHDLVRDEHKRWSVPAHGLSASVAHCADYSAVAFGPGLRLGVDIQDERDRPGAMRWLGELLGHPEGRPATLREFAECEALIKASHVTKETFAGVRLPAWRPGWRLGNVGGYHLRSLTLPGGGMHLALAADRAVPVRWWSRPRPDARPAMTDVPRWEAA